jgi:hypothetical protein
VKAFVNTVMKLWVPQMAYNFCRAVLTSNFREGLWFHGLNFGAVMFQTLLREVPGCIPTMFCASPDFTGQRNVYFRTNYDSLSQGPYLLTVSVIGLTEIEAVDFCS